MRAPDRAHAIKDVVHRCGAERAGGGQLFVRVGDGEAFLIVFNDFGPCVARGDPVAKAGAVHRECVALALAFDHPLGQHQANAAALGKSCHDGTGGPVVAHAGHRADQRVAVRGKGEGPVDHRFDACAFQRGKAVVGKGNAVLDLVEVIGQQFMAKVPRRAVNGPGFAGLFVKPDAEAAALLPEVAFASRVHHMRMFAACVDDRGDFRHLIGDDILVLHRVQREVDAGHCTDLARPKTACVDDMFGVHGALVRDHIPAAVGALVGLYHLAVGFDRGAAHARGLGVGVGGAGGIKVAVERIIKPANNAVDIGHWRDLGDVFGRDDLCLQPHETVLGAFRFQHVEPFLIFGQGDAAHVVETAGHAGDFFKLAIEFDRIALQRGHVGVAIERMKAAGGVPGGARRQLGAFDQHDIGPAEFGQMVENRTPDDTAADHCYPCGCFHRRPRCVVFALVGYILDTCEQ